MLTTYAACEMNGGEDGEMATDCRLQYASADRRHYLAARLRRRRCRPRKPHTHADARSYAYARSYAHSYTGPYRGAEHSYS